MLKSTHIAVLSISVLAALSLTDAAHASGCPTADTVQDGFTLEKHPVQTDVLRGAGPVTRVVNMYGGGQEQTVLYYRGLIELYRTNRDSHSLRYPQKDLGELFPLKGGDRHSFQYVSTTPEEVSGALQTLDLEIGGSETLSLGACRYDVLVIKKVFKREGREVDAWSVLYSPELEMTLARRYDAGTAQETTIGYAGIGLFRR